MGIGPPDPLTIDEIVAAARASLPAGAWDRLAGAAESETTARRNRRALDSIALRPRVLVGVTDVDTSTTFLGQRLRIPVLLANMADPDQLWPAGGNAITEAASAFGTLRFTGRAPERSGPWILEISAHAPPEARSAAIAGADQEGCAGVCLALMPAIAGRRERERRAPRSLPRRTRDVWRVVTETAGAARAARLPLIAKGVSTAADALLALDHGCAAIYVSNNGGRALDHAEATIDALPGIVEAVEGRAEVIVDGGFMRGTDIIKALATGAAAVAIGRLQGYGLAAGGAASLSRTLEILEDEMRVSLSLLGATDVGALGKAHLSHDAPLVRELDWT